MIRLIGVRLSRIPIRVTRVAGGWLAMLARLWIPDCEELSMKTNVTKQSFLKNPARYRRTWSLAMYGVVHHADSK